MNTRTHYVLFVLLPPKHPEKDTYEEACFSRIVSSGNMR
jgi:hypothetical protein